MSKKQYKQAYGAIRYICHDHDNYDYAPKNCKHRDADKELAALPWLVVGAAYVSFEVNDNLRDPLNRPGRYLALCIEKERKRKDAEWRKRAENTIVLPKAEYQRLMRLAKKGQMTP